MAPKHGVDDIKREDKRRRVLATTEADVQVKAELDGTIIHDQGRICSKVQSIISQPTPSQPPDSQSILSQSNAPQSVLEWFDAYKSCERFFLDHAQDSPYVQAVCAHINIRLPYQKITISPPTTSFPWLPPPKDPKIPPSENNDSQTVSLTPYIRRLICTGHDTDTILKEFFGSSWFSGLSKIHEQEERNYLFAAKSADWLKVKMAYDIGSEETAPFLVPLRKVTVKKIMDAERDWSEWLAMQDWEVGFRRPPSLDA
jgi:hypothetical protein